jgi:2-methylcitrate dehydratase PrpD
MHIMANADQIQAHLSGYAAQLSNDDIDETTGHAAKLRVIDTLGALIGGFDGEPCRVGREIAARSPQTNGASVNDLRAT